MRPLKHDVKRAAYLNDGLYMTDIQQSQDVLIAREWLTNGSLSRLEISQNTQ